MIGLFGAAALNGQFQLISNWVQQSGMAVYRWRAVGYAALCASAVFALTWFASQRLLRRSPFKVDGS